MSYSNFVQARVVAPVAATATTLSLYAAEAPYQLPALDGGLLVLTDSPYKPSVIEVISYTSRSAQDLLGVVRGLEGTTAVEWSGNVYCYQSLMAGDFQSQLGLKANLDSPTLTGNPTAPTQATTDNDTSIATTAFVRAAMALFGVGANTPEWPKTTLNDFTVPTGFYRAASSVTDTPFADYWGVAIEKAPDGAYVRQSIWCLNNATRIFERVISSGVAVPWRELWHTGNLVKQTSTTDTTAGAMMAVGAFGVGSVSPVPSALASWNDLPAVNGRWTAQQVANSPRGVQDWCILDQYVHDNLYRMQVALVITGPLQNRVYRRTQTNGTWNPWREFYTEANIVGPIVSSVEGAIIERGSNANGEYVRFADGTQICTRRYTVSLNLAAGTVSSGLTWTFPAPFVNADWTGSVTNRSGWVYEYLASFEGVSTTEMSGIYIKNLSNTTRTMSHVLNLIAIGRWY